MKCAPTNLVKIPNTKFHLNLLGNKKQMKHPDRQADVHDLPIAR
jgi:hypothetical protein